MLFNSFTPEIREAIKAFTVTKDSKYLIITTFIGSIFVYDIENERTVSHFVTDIKINHCELSYGDKFLLFVLYWLIAGRRQSNGEGQHNLRIQHRRHQEA